MKSSSSKESIFYHHLLLCNPHIFTECLLRPGTWQESQTSEFPGVIPTQPTSGFLYGKLPERFESSFLISHSAPWDQLLCLKTKQTDRNCSSHVSCLHADLCSVGIAKPKNTAYTLLHWRTRYSKFERCQNHLDSLWGNSSATPSTEQGFSTGTHVFIAAVLLMRLTSLQDGLLA